MTTSRRSPPTRNCRTSWRSGWPADRQAMGAVRILGIDPGLNRTGWGIVRIRGQPAAPYRPRRRRLRSDDAAVRSACRRSIRNWPRSSSPGPRTSAAVEEVFVQQEPRLDPETGHGARRMPAGARDERAQGRRIRRQPGQEIRVGTGHADKTQVAMMVGGPAARCASQSRRRRCAGRRHLSCASSAGPFRWRC